MHMHVCFSCNIGQVCCWESYRKTQGWSSPSSLIRMWPCVFTLEAYCPSSINMDSSFVLVIKKKKKKKTPHFFYIFYNCTYALRIEELVCFVSGE